jgi:protein-arginine kinase activator protein McsA
MENKEKKQKKCKDFVANILQMTRDLWVAVEIENYERAAVLRDLIRDEQEAYKTYLEEL